MITIRVFLPILSSQKVQRQIYRLKSIAGLEFIYDYLYQPLSLPMINSCCYWHRFVLDRVVIALAEKLTPC